MGELGGEGIRRRVGKIVGFEIPVVKAEMRTLLGEGERPADLTTAMERAPRPPGTRDGVLEGMKKDHGINPRRVEGLPEARWILMDYLDVVVHLFTPEAREYYRLEQLWGEAPKTQKAAL